MNKPDTVWKILHIDDDPDDHVLTREMLSQSKERNIVVDWAASFDQGRSRLLHCLNGLASQYDAVLVDYDLGAHTGIALIQEFGQQLAIPLILYTGRGSHEVDIEALQAGATMYLSKTEATPLLLERLIRYAIELKKKERELDYSRKLLQQELIERSRAEDSLSASNAALAKSEKKFAKAFLSSPVALAITRAADDRYLEVNESYCEIVGYTRDEVIGRTALELEIYASPVQWKELLGLLAKHGSVRNHEIEVRTKSGAIRALLGSFDRFELDQERCTLATLINITERKKAEDEQRRSDERLRSFIESTHDVMFTLDHEWRFLYANQRFKEIFQTNIDELHGKLFWDVCPHCFRTTVEAHYRMAMEERLPVQFQHAGIDQPSWHEVNVYPTPDGIAVFIQDRTEEKRALEALEASEAALRAQEKVLNERAAMFRDMANNISQLAWMADETGSIFWYNQRWFDYTGTSLDEMQGWGWQKAHHPDHVQRVVEKISHCFSTGEPWEDVFPLRGKDGQYGWFFSQAVPIKDDQGKVIRWFGTNTDVTEERLLEEENRKQKDLLERLVQSAPAAIAFLHGPQHTYTLANRAYEQIARGKGPLVGRTVAEVWPEIADTIGPQLDRVYQQSESYSVIDAPLTILRQEGPEVDYFSYTFTPINHADGSIEGVMILAVETTEDVNHRQTGEIQSAQLAAVLQALPVGVWIIDETGRALMTNSQASRIWAGAIGLPENYEQYNSYRGWWTKTGEEIKGDQWPIAQALIQNRVINAVGIEIERLNGTRGSTLVSATPIYAANGQALGAVAVMMDITERRLAEQALTRSEEKFAKAFRSSPVAIAISTLAEGRFIDVNDRYTALIGFSREEIIGRTSAELGLFPNIDDRKEVVRRFREGNGFQDYELCLKIRTGEIRTVLFAAEGMEVDGQECMLSLVIDITERKQAEAMQKESEARLIHYAEELERSNQALRDFAFIASHDLQEPLRKIQAFGKLLDAQFSGSLQEDGRGYLNRMISAAGRMEQMLQGLLSYSQVNIRAEPFVEIEMQTVMQDVLSDLEIRIQETQAVVTVGDLPRIHADPLQIRQLVQNLVGNALKYHQPGAAPKVSITSRHNGDEYIELIIKDEGIGLSMNDARRIFQPFVRLHNRGNYEGTGMGLAICQKIVERHGGSIAVESSPDQGAAFHILLPKAPSMRS